MKVRRAEDGGAHELFLPRIPNRGHADRCPRNIPRGLNVPDGVVVASGVVAFKVAWCASRSAAILYGKEAGFGADSGQGSIVTLRPVYGVLSWRAM